MDTRRNRASTTVEAPPSWGGGSFFMKKTLSPPPPSTASPPSPTSTSSPPPISQNSRTSSMAVMRTAPATDPQHRRAPSLASSLDTSAFPPTASSLKSFSPTHEQPASITVSNSASSPSLASARSPRSTLPPSAFASAGLQLPQPNSKSTSSRAKGFTQTIVDFIRSPRGTPPKIVSSPTPNPYLNPNTNMDTAVFGVALELAVKRSNHIHELLPDVVYKCFIYLRDKGPLEEGIFRLTGSVNDIKKIRDAFDNGQDYDISSCLNPHTVAGVLKLFIRESPQRLIPSTWSWSEARPMQELHDLVKQLPPQNQCFLSCLIKLLGSISRASDVTKMGVPNLVIVFSAALQCTGSFLTHVINYAQELFPDDELGRTREHTEAEKKVSEEREREEKEKEEKEKQEREREEATEREDRERASRAEREKADRERHEHKEKKRGKKERKEKESRKEEGERKRTEKYSDGEDGGTTKEREHEKEKKERKKHREHGHKRKDKRRTEVDGAPKEHPKVKKDHLEPQKEEEVHQEKAHSPLFEEDKETEKDNTWVSHMEQYEKGEEKRRKDRELGIVHIGDHKEIAKAAHTSGEEEKTKMQEKREIASPKLLTVEVKSETEVADEEDMFKEEKEKVIEVVETEKDKRKVKSRMHTIFDSDDEEGGE